MFPAMFLASPDPMSAEPANAFALLNLSHLENATVFVIVRINATTK